MKKKLLFFAGLFAIGSLITLNSCKKDDATNITPKKTYTILYEVTGIGEPASRFTFTYVKAGTSYIQTIDLPAAEVSASWSTTFTASSGDSLSIKCSPPSSTIGYTPSVFLSIKYNGILLNKTNATWPASAEAKGTLP